jgi:hypothetical protein
MAGKKPGIAAAMSAGAVLPGSVCKSEGLLVVASASGNESAGMSVMDPWQMFLVEYVPLYLILCRVASHRATP